MTGGLLHMGIKSIAVELSTDRDSVSELPSTFIAHCRYNNDEHFCFVELNGNRVTVTHNTKDSLHLSVDEFCDIWSGIVMVIEDEDSYDIKSSNRSVISKILIGLAGAMIVTLFVINGVSLFHYIHFILSVVGIVVCSLIVQHEIGVQSDTLNKLCADTNKKTSCTDVLNSKGSRISENIRLSDIGIVYFATVCLSWIIYGFTGSPNSNLIALISVSAIPFTMFSIYYQRIIVQKWCPLCLSVIAVLWTQAISVISVNNLSFIPENIINDSSILLFSLISVSVIWYFIQPLLKTVQDYRELSINHSQFKKNYDIFKSLINSKPVVDTNIYNTTDIIIGDRSNSAPVKIVLITNPLCGHCKEAHRIVTDLLKRWDNGVQINIRFSVNISDLNSVDTRIAMHLIDIYNNESEKSFIRALDQAYYIDDKSKWLDSRLTGPDTSGINVLIKHKKWCHSNDIMFTPEILVNGRSFPTEYQRDELSYFIEDIIEELNEQLVYSTVEQV
jgi:uncharacterized membrane protein/thiol-disulfide isomerase/thioredoxin